MLYTIGHSTHEFDAFVALLRRHGVELLVDVRSQPYSRWAHFRRDELSLGLRNAGLDYLFLGRELGARREEPEAYDGEFVDFERARRLPLFRAGIARVLELSASRRLALMCAEKEPLDCHRTKLICAELRGQVDIEHILFDGSLENDAETQRRAAQRRGVERTLF